MTKRFAIGFFYGLLIFLAINLTVAHLSSDCGLPAVFGRDACADDIVRAGWPMHFYEEGGFDYRFIFNFPGLILDAGIGVWMAVFTTGKVKIAFESHGVLQPRKSGRVGT